MNESKDSLLLRIVVKSLEVFINSGYSIATLESDNCYKEFPHE